MRRPCFIVLDREFPGSISTRKLVIETAKLNVITAYSGAEALDLLQRFPAVDGIVIDAGSEDISCEILIQKINALAPKLTTVAILAPGHTSCSDATFQLESFEPNRLLEILKRVRPADTEALEQNEARLNSEDAAP
jgi:response regulator RpfG family c-di-GMP phosphodiesterase